MILNFEEFGISEANIQIKRKYTDKNPKQIIKEKSKIKANIIKKIADGNITEDELQSYLLQLTTNKNWPKQNYDLFSIEEDAEGKKTYKLSKKGLKIHNLLSKKINEGIEQDLEDIKALIGEIKIMLTQNQEIENQEN